MNKSFEYLTTDKLIMTANFLMEDGLAIQGQRPNEMLLAEGQWLHVVCTLGNIEEPYQWLFNEFGLTDDTVRVAMKYAKFKVHSFIKRTTAEDIIFRILPYKNYKIETVPFWDWDTGRHGADAFSDLIGRKILEDAVVQPVPRGISKYFMSSLPHELDRWGMIAHGFNSQISPLSTDLSKIIEEKLRLAEHLKKFTPDMLGIPADRMGGPSAEIIGRWRTQVREGYIKDPSVTFSFFDWKEPSKWKLFKRWIKNLYRNALHNRKRGS